MQIKFSKLGCHGAFQVGAGYFPKFKLATIYLGKFVLYIYWQDKI